MRDKLISEFGRLKAQPEVKASSPMMSQFRMFPQAQRTMLRAVQSEEVLIKYVEIYLEMGEATIKQWVKVGSYISERCCHWEYVKLKPK